MKTSFPRPLKNLSNNLLASIVTEEFGTYIIRNWVDNEREWGYNL